jgi:ubiquitin carboxyl-terminal hydrolase 9/13
MDIQGQAGSNGATPVKKDPNAPQPTPLEKLLADSGPLRSDGSDKFFGFENVRSVPLTLGTSWLANIGSSNSLAVLGKDTCIFPHCTEARKANILHSYCNSIVQCLYYSVPFREQVINFPTRAPHDTLKRKLVASHLAAEARPVQPAKPAPAVQPVSSSPRTKAPPPQSTQNGPPKPEDNKDSPEYKKRVALQTGPVLNMDFENAEAYGMTESLFTSLKDIFEAMIVHESRLGVVSPTKFLDVLKRENEMFRTPMHQDAHEFLNLLLNQVVENVEQYSKDSEVSGKVLGEVGATAVNGLTDAMAPVANSVLPSTMQIGTKQSSRWVHELFEGLLTSETRCLTCENVSQRDEAFLDLSVDLENHNSVTSCLRRFSEEEMLCERNKFHCDNCSGLQEAEKRMKIKRLPRILALHLKRFKYTEDMQRLQKLFHRVVYPYYLRLFNTTDDAEDPDRLYELYAVVVHIGGGPYHGHYVSIIKTQDRGWLLFDDEMVEPVDKRFVTKFFGEGLDANGHPKNLACAYVLFYQETTVEAMERELDSEGVPSAATSAEASKEPFVKANGFANGSAHGPGTPISEDVEAFASLDHAATAPAIPVGSPPQSSNPFTNPLEHVPTSPAIPFLKRKKSKSEIQAKEEQKRLEKEQQRLEKEGKERKKAEEKELEKQAKLKKKEAEAAKAKAASKPPVQVPPQAPESSNASSSAVEDGPPLGATGLGLDDPSLTFSNASHPKENGVAGPEKTMLHRFRNTSMSINRKGHFWSSSKDKDKEKTRKSEDLPVRPLTPEEQLNESLLGGQGSGSPELKPEKEKGKKDKSLFGLGRKKSVNLLSRNH